MYTVDEKIKSFYIYTSGLAKATALLLFSLLSSFFLFLRSSSFYIYRIFVFLHSCFLFLLLLSFPFFFLRSFFLLFLLLSSSFIFTLVFFFIVLLLHVMGIIANPYEVSPILRCMSLRLHCILPKERVTSIMMTVFKTAVTYRGSPTRRPTAWAQPPIVMPIKYCCQLYCPKNSGFYFSILYSYSWVAYSCGSFAACTSACCFLDTTTLLQPAPKNSVPVRNAFLMQMVRFLEADGRRNSRQ